MAKYSGSNWGQVRNKLGRAVGRVWNGIDVVSQYQPDVSNPNTLPQQLSRAKWRVLTKMCRYLRQAIMTSFALHNKEAHTTPYAMFTKANFGAVSASSPSDVTVSYPALKLSVGGGVVPAGGTVDYGTTQHLKVEVPFSYPVDNQMTFDEDAIYCCLYCPELNRSIVEKGFAADTGIMVVVPSTWNGLEVYTYLWSVGGNALNKGICSDTEYVGHGEIE